jgi:hypothetical protein
MRMMRMAAALSAIAIGGAVAPIALAPVALAQTQTQPARPAQPAQAQPARPAQPQPARPAQAQPAQAQPARPAQPAAPGGASPNWLGQFGDWAAYASAGNPRTCFALSQPKERLPAGLKRDPAYMFVSSRPGENVRNEVSVVMGFSVKEDAETALQVGTVAYAMIVKDDNLWIKNAAEEARLVDALRKGRDLVVRATSRRGNATTDRYSLAGLGQALDRAAQECR